MELTIEENKIFLWDTEPLFNHEVRQHIPGAFWNSAIPRWEFPLTRRVVVELRKLLTGKALVVAEDNRRQLTEVGNSTPTPDAVILNEKIVVSFEFHKKYQEFMKTLKAYLQKNGTWSLPLSSASELIKGITDRDLDLVVADEVLDAAKPKPIPGFTGTLSSLYDIPVSVLSSLQRPSRRGKKEKPLYEKLSNMGITSLFDLIFNFPQRYIDRSNPTFIKNCVVGDEVVIVGRIVSVERKNQGKGRGLLKVVVEDGEKSRINMAFFNQAYLAKFHFPGQNVIVSGKYEIWRGNGVSVAQISSPKIDALGTSRGEERIIPVYSQSPLSDVTTWDIRAAVQELFQRIDNLEEFLHEDKIREYILPGLYESLKGVHFPSDTKDIELYKRRLIYDELLFLQHRILSFRSEYDGAKGLSNKVTEGDLFKSFIASLPYSMTDAQKRVWGEISADLKSSKPMHRLLQGDVGSGKTTLAYACMISALESGTQGVIMAPTEILAEQLYTGLAEQLIGIGVNGEQIDFLGSKVTKKSREKILEKVNSGETRILVGTHSVLSDELEFENLGIVIIDEQHRFGTLQRNKLKQARKDGLTPDLLVMSATPIPRTGALVLYGDLDLSTIDELPPGRVPINTHWIDVPAEEFVLSENRVWKKVKEEVDNSRQAYIVASLIEDNDTIAAASAEEAYGVLAEGVFRDYKVGLLHGKMNRKLREEVMQKFLENEIQILVSTTVIEVGVNVPNATLMVVLDAGRFGISQLHQIRGRVGRSTYESHCFLVGETKTEEGRERLEALVASNDGFYLAEKDLEIRGEGTLFGTKQSGVSDLKLASITRDLRTLEVAKRDAAEILHSSSPLLYQEITELVKKKFSGKEIAS